MEHLRLGNRAVTTIFIGGGTPSILSTDALAQLFTDIHQHFQITPNAEITVECNPGTVDSEKLKVMRDNGANRLQFRSASHAR